LTRGNNPTTFTALSAVTAVIDLARSAKAGRLKQVFLHPITQSTDIFAQQGVKKWSFYPHQMNSRSSHEPPRYLYLHRFDRFIIVRL
jgi:hypothetical protein